MLNCKAALLAAAGAVALLSSAFAQDARAMDVTMEDVLNDQKTTGDIVTYGLGPRAQRYSPLDKINRDTVGSLVPAFSFSFGGEKQRGQESQALVRDGVIYVTGSYSRVWAIDARTGKELWQYDHRLPEGILPCCDVVNRGAAAFGNMIIFGTLDAKLVALDAKTGKVIWTKTIDDFKAGYSFTAAPLIVPSEAFGPIVVTGVSGGEFGIVGRVEARKVENGELVWSRPVIEGHMGQLAGKDSTVTGEKTHPSWEGDMWKWGGGATWLGGTYDPATKLIFVGTGNPAPWNSWLRKGDNLYSCSRLAIDPETGEIKWHFQTTPHDGWDYDGVNELIPFDYEEDGKTVQAAATADRNGFFYVLDRTNGKFIRGAPFVSKITWAEPELNDDGSPVFIKDNRPGNPGKEKKGEVVFSAPSFLGGKNQMPMSYNPNTGLFYIPSNEWGMDIWNEPVTYKKGAAYLGAGFTIKPLYDDHIGVLRAVDPKTAKIVWEVENPSPLWGGTLTTAGGLVFAGNPEGFLNAYDAKTGELLWKFNTGSGVVSPPVTWEMDGEQYIGVASGWGGAVPLWGGEVAKLVGEFNQGGSYWVFKLPKTVASN